MRPPASCYPNLDAVLCGDISDCPQCGEDAGEGERDSFDGLTDVYNYSCGECGCEWLLVYRFVGVSIKSTGTGDDGTEDREDWTEYPVAEDQRFKPEDAQATGV